MKIGNQENVTSLKFTHKGLNMHFGCQKQMEFIEMRDIVKQEERVEIRFYDIREMDFLIAMLEKFRMDCMDKIGIWSRR